MHPMPMEDEELPPEEGAEDADAELDAQLLQELLEWSGKSSANDMRARLGKPMPGAEDELGLEGAGDELPPEDPEIPGVEAVPEGGGEAAGGPDIAKLKAALARMKG